MPVAAPSAASAAAMPPLAHKPARKRAHPSKAAVAAKTATQMAETAPAPVLPPARVIPNWPANSNPTAATVRWDSHGLQIDAANSSLEQILQDVATATGARIEGIGSDQRVFGTYGPGSAREVLSQLLEGCGYNVLMIGDQGQDSALHVVLSARGASTAQNAPSNSSANSDDDSDSDDQPPVVQQPIPPVHPGISPRMPQQMPQRNIQPNH